ncbi:UNVERIFIED_CONTAM: hypothetical protein K2H54_005315 [Gekko kuhli]
MEREAMRCICSFIWNPREVGNPEPLPLEVVLKALAVLPEVVSSLQEADHPKIQRLLDHLHVWLHKETSASVAAEVAGHMPPLLDAVPEYVRVFACTTFQAMLERGAERDVHHLALRSLVPVLLHLRDDSPTVVEASWNILNRLAAIVGHQELEPVLQKKKETSTFLAMVKQFCRVPACHFLPQVINHLSSPLANTREAAIRMLGFIGTDTRDQRKLAVIYRGELSPVLSPPPPGGRLALLGASVCHASPFLLLDGSRGGAFLVPPSLLLPYEAGQVKEILPRSAGCRSGSAPAVEGR